MDEMGGKTDVQALKQVLRDRDQHYMKRMAAAEALGEIGDQSTIEQLIQALDVAY